MISIKLIFTKTDLMFTNSTCKTSTSSLLISTKISLNFASSICKLSTSSPLMLAEFHLMFVNSIYRISMSTSTQSALSICIAQGKLCIILMCHRNI